MDTQAEPATVPKRTVHLLGNLVTFLATDADTNGAYSLVEVTTAPGAGTPPHRQNSDEEAFYVLEGTYEFFHEGRVIKGGPGTHLLIKRGEAHAFKNASDMAARMLIMNSPAGLHEKFFDEAGDAVEHGAGFPPAGAPDMPRLMAAATRYDIEFLLPAA